MVSYEEKLAKLACEYSLKVNKGDIVEIRGESCAEPLIKECFKKVLEIGAYPVVKMSIKEQLSYFYKYANDDILKLVPEFMISAANTVSSMIVIDSETNTKQLTTVDTTKIAENRKATKILKDIMFDRESRGEFRWVIVPYPTHSMAQDAEMPFEEYSSFVFNACKLNEENPVAEWEKVKIFQDTIVNSLTGIKKLKIIGNDTELYLNVEGRKWINCCGSHNMPDGEVFTSPVEDSAEGTIYFDIPTSFMGVEAAGVKLHFENGKVVKSSAEKGESFLQKILETDEGSKLVGEIAFGLNESITKHSKNILFDEKIGKTIHLAVGSSYQEAGGLNKSGIHWDLIKDMRHGEVFADGNLIFKNGRFVFDNRK